MSRQANITRVLGIDPGTVVTGYGVIDKAGNALSHVDSGVISPGRTGSMPERLAVIHRGVEQLIAEHRPDVLAVEEAFFGENPKTAIKLGQARGVVLVLGALNDLEVVEYSPRAVKQAVVGTGGASKEQVQFMVAKVLKLRSEPDSPDIADALAVAICYALRPAETEVTNADSARRSGASGFGRSRQRRT